MNVTGIIAEYNPLHAGHRHHLAQARRETDADYLVVVMSGDYVQRGEPAVAGKHVRARMALLAGADLVLELPFPYAFAAAGVEAVCMPPHLIYQTAWGVARAALELARAGELVDAGRLNPHYHRLSQAERERLERLSGTNS